MKIVRVLGGLGNQMFQYAFAYSLKQIDKTIRLDITDFKNYQLHNGYELEKVFGSKIKSISLFSNSSYKKKSLLSIILKKFLFKLGAIAYEKKHELLIKKELEKKIYFDGYWQSEKYFQNIEEEIRENFVFNDFTEEKNIKIIESLKNKNTVSIHVRRGDYLKHPLHGGICNLKYYQAAIELIRNIVENPYFLIFSDDMEWCKKNLKLEDDYVLIDWNKKESSYRDMQLMSTCKHNIIANSSFSWWGAWLNLNQDKIVIAPQKWFNDTSFNQKDILPEKWLKI